MNSFRSVVGEQVRFHISPHSKCPCGSGYSACNCCLTVSGFIKTAALTSPPAPPTGNALPRCYAAPLADCSPKLSREHFVSASLLEELNVSNQLRVSGLRWQDDGQSKHLKPNALASKILCDRHNSALSPLDAIAVNLFQAVNEENMSGTGRQLLFLFSGSDIERWMLKILCGFAYSGNLLLENEVDISVPKAWLDILFGYMDFAAGQGLYVCRSVGHVFETARQVKLRTISNRTHLNGLGLWVCGYELILSMSGFASRKFDGREMVYRPLELYTIGREFEKSIMLSWQGVADLGTISIQIEEGTQA